jgi:glycosyltransferase involved in cell wall biosynthesis
VKIAVAVHGRFHGFDLARELYNRDSLARLLTTYPAFAVRRVLPAHAALATSPWIEAWRRSTDKLSFLPRQDVTIGRAFGRFVARHMPTEADIFVGWSGASLEAMPAARERGMRIVLERGSSHIAHQADILAEAYTDVGSKLTPVDPRMIERELTEYAAADLIAVPTKFAADTFINRGVPAGKLLVNPYGADLNRFASVSPAIRPASRVQVLFVGEVGVRKGVPWLLRAFDRLDDGFDLHLVGPITPEVKKILLPNNDRVHVHGPLRAVRLDQAFTAADVFCLPSLEEGLPLSLLQAMAASLPVIATPETGAADVITDGIEGLIVNSRSVDSLAAAMTNLKETARRQRMGAAARMRVANSFSWDAYGDRAVTAYRSLLNQ